MASRKTSRKPPSKGSAGKTVIDVHYIKSPQMVTVAADGGIGGVSPRGMITVALYNERVPIPVLQEIDVVGTKVGETRTIEARKGIVRQVDCELYMTPEAAKSLGEWLLQQADKALKIRADLREEGVDLGN